MPAYTSVSSCALLIWPFLTVSCHKKHTRSSHMTGNRSLVVIQERKGVSNRENRLWFIEQGKQTAEDSRAGLWQPLC